jgi:hypothetical protein
VEAKGHLDLEEESPTGAQVLSPEARLCSESNSGVLSYLYQDGGLSTLHLNKQLWARLQAPVKFLTLRGSRERR